MVVDALRTYVQLASGLTEVTRERAVSAAKALVAQVGAMSGAPAESTAQVRGLADELAKMARTNRDLVMDMVRTETERAVASVGVASGDEVAGLERRVAALERELAQRPASDGGGPERTDPDSSRAVPTDGPGGEGLNGGDPDGDGPDGDGPDGDGPDGDGADGDGGTSGDDDPTPAEGAPAEGAAGDDGAQGAAAEGAAAEDAAAEDAAQEAHGAEPTAGPPDPAHATPLDMPQHDPTDVDDSAAGADSAGSDVAGSEDDTDAPEGPQDPAPPDVSTS